MNMKYAKGMRIGYRKYAAAGSIIALLAAFLPFINMPEKSYNLFTFVANIGDVAVVGKIIYIAILATVILGILITAAIYVIPSPKLAAAQSAIFSVLSACLLISLFMTKRVVDGAGMFADKFMVKYFGAGYFILLAISFITLFFAMKTAKIHPGYIVLVILSIIWLFPISWIVLTAFRAESGYYVGYYIPKGFTLDNFIKLFTDTSIIHFGKWWVNTLLVAVCNCVFSTIIVLMTAFTLSRTRFNGRLAFMKVMLIIGMFPGFMSMVAVYNILKGIGIAQTLGALILVNAAGAAMGYYIVKGFFDTIPKSLDEAALLDGATKWQIFTKITIPMSKSVIIYTILTSFMGPWGDYIFPSMMLGDNQASYTVALGLKWLTDFRRIDTYYTQFAAGALLVSLPIVILFIGLQKFYVEGMSGAVKG